MDGKDAARLIRQKGFKEIPIIAMTAASMKGDREKCVAAGMNDYISKPIRKEVLYKMIKKWVPDKN
ncbi:MAG: response regulator [Acidobacteria bacterium]|jgi:CheY-like chemotaxis protein|nr:response regulator [Acidobacteriota bacterium]